MPKTFSPADEQANTLLCPLFDSHENKRRTSSSREKKIKCGSKMKTDLGFYLPFCPERACFCHALKGSNYPVVLPRLLWSKSCLSVRRGVFLSGYVTEIPPNGAELRRGVTNYVINRHVLKKERGGKIYEDFLFLMYSYIWVETTEWTQKAEHSNANARVQSQFRRKAWFHDETTSEYLSKLFTCELLCAHALTKRTHWTHKKIEIIF